MKNLIPSPTMRPNQHLLVLCSALLAGCASGPSELEQEVTFTSKPDRAMVELDGVRIGRTPIRVTLDRTRNHELLVGKSGYEVKQTILRPGLTGAEYGFNPNIKVELNEDSGTPSDVPEEDLPAFNRAKQLADAPFGADPATYGTLQGDLDDARKAAESLGKMAEAARNNAVAAEAALNKRLAEAKQASEKDAAAAETRLESSEKALRAALDEAKAAEQQLADAQQVVAQRVAFLESLRRKGEAAPKQATEEVAAAKLETEAAERRVVLAQTAVVEATAALKAAAEARAAAQGPGDQRVQSLASATATLQKSTAETAEKLEASSRVVAARVEELSRQIAEGKSGDAARLAELESARKENAELNVQLAAARDANAKETAAAAEKALQEANERVVALEQKLADSKLAAEAKARESRARTYAEYTARKGLLERRLRNGELNNDSYREALAELDKELRNR